MLMFCFGSNGSDRIVGTVVGRVVSLTRQIEQARSHPLLYESLS
jgi:hypothetical protein